MPGYAKINYASRQSQSDGIDYVWVDTCCIDKSSSAELSESINSMYRWYQKSAVCYAYLEDVTSIMSEVHSENLEFRCSRWFTRGWTLQELIAPAKVLFFGKKWTYLGDKLNLSSLISSITRIHEDVVQNPPTLSRMSVAKRMSWAATRETTRIEDVAYSLLGIFGVNMPLLYGEGNKAFIRLQEEILKESDDQSLFAWNCPMYYEVNSLGILATSPIFFMGSGNIIPIPSTLESQAYSMTNKGLHIKIPLSKYLENYYIALLDCQYETDFSGCLGIVLEETVASNVYQRKYPLDSPIENPVRKCTANETERSQIRAIYILKKSYWSPMKPEKYGTFLVMSDSMRHHGYHIVEVMSTSQHSMLWDLETQVLKKPSSDWWTALKFYNSKLDFGFFVILYKLYRDGGAVKIIDIPPDGTLKSSFFREMPTECNDIYRFMRTVHARDGEKPTIPLEVIAKVETEERLNQSVFVLEVRIGNIQGRFSLPKCVPKYFALTVLSIHRRVAEFTDCVLACSRI
jgi:hypothetical protein